MRLGIMVDCLVGRLHHCIDAEWMASIRVAVVVWKVAARYLQADLVAFEEHVAGRPNVEDVLISLAGVDQRDVLSRVAVTRADDAIV